jgi:hypothetical protein
MSYSYLIAHVPKREIRWSKYFGIFHVLAVVLVLVVGRTVRAGVTLEKAII